jgi:Cu2+-exporting ATPase
MNRLPDSVEREQPDGSFARVSTRRLAVGDRVRVRPGEAFPADGVLEQGQTQVDESLLTGESRPVSRNVGATVVAGSHNLSATVLVRVQVVGAGTRFAQIVGLMESAAATKPQGARLADRLAKPFLVAVLFAALVAAVWWWPTDPGHALMVAVAVLVVTCPCALSLATPAAILAAAGSLARGGVLVRNLQALESLAEVDSVVFDKTGTLTRDAMVLGQVRTRDGVSADRALQMAAALAVHSLHPVSRALHRAAVLAPCANGPGWTCHTVAETPGAGVEGAVQVGQGTPATLRLGSAAYCQVAQDAGDSLCAYLSDAQGWVATFSLDEALRAEAVTAVQALQSIGLQVHMLSGDSTASVERVAASLGMAGHGVASRVQGECTPADKLAVLRDLQQAGHKVAMVGDGLNDGPVLAGAHVSFAFGTAVPLAQAKSDLVVVGDQLMAVVQAVFLARKTMQVVRQNLWWALLYNAACVPLAMFGYLPAWLAGLGMAASSLLVVMNALRLAAPLSQR